MTSSQPPVHNGSNRSSKWWTAAGIFLVVLGVYVLSGPGRIDITDGLARYDASYNWLVEGRPVLRDPKIVPFLGVPGRDGLRYSYYGAPASLFSMPLIWLAQITDTPEAGHFLFSLTSGIFGSALALVLFLFYLELGLSKAQAVFWTLVSSFATLIWPASTSTFDNAQHAFFFLAALYLGFLSAKRGSLTLAASSGLVASVLMMYQEYLLLVIPALAVSTLKLRSTDNNQNPGPSARSRKSWYSTIASKAYHEIRSHIELWGAALRGPGEARDCCIRFSVCIVIAVAAGFTLSLAYNHLRFGSYFDNGKLRPNFHSLPFFGNPVAGLMTLLVSPGKSIFLYSPPLILSLLGLVHLRRVQRELFLAIAATSILLISFISCILFVGGDWCWGPRYLVPLLPLWALAFPFIGDKLRRPVVLLIVVLGLVVQVLAVSVENQRFFFERGLKPYFWAEDRWFYFKHSALSARVGEAFSLTKGLPSNAMSNSIPISKRDTYTILTASPRALPNPMPEWMLNFYYRPRPWPLWMSWINRDLRPINLRGWVWALFGVLTLGVGMICRGLLVAKDEQAHWIARDRQISNLY